MRLVQPRVLILFGKLAIDTFLGPGATLCKRIGQRFERDNRVLIPLPHSSGASTWLNMPENKALLTQAITTLATERQRILIP